MKRASTHTVSVIIPAFNAGLFLRKAVESAIVQGPSVREIIIVNNNSTDDTAEVMAELRREYEELIVTTSCGEQGPAAARNHGVHLANGEWLQFLDADDYLYPGKVKRQLLLLRPDIDWITGVSDVVEAEKKISTFWLEDNSWKGLLFCRGMGNTNANLFRRSAILAVGGYDDFKVGEDYHLYFKLLKGGYALVQDVVSGSAYVQHDGFRGEGRGLSIRHKFRFGFVTEIASYLQRHETDRYQQMLPTINAAKVAALRMYMTGDAEEGSKLASTIISEVGPFSKMELTELPFYWRLYQCFGFSAVEKARVRWRKWT